MANAGWRLVSLRRLVVQYFWPTIAVIAISVALTPYIADTVSHQRPIAPSELQVLRDHILIRDKTLRDYALANHELDIALGWIYKENGVDRVTFDIDLTTGAFIPYAKGRAPN